MSFPTRSVPRTSPLSWWPATGVYTVLLFSLGHFFVDLYSGALGIFQPVLVQKLGLTLTQAGILGGALVFSSSVTQPLYGYLSDRYRSPLFSTLAPAIAGLFITSMAFAPSFSSAVALALAGGAGVSSFHPQASSWAPSGIQKNKAHWMAVFISAGTLGIALAPSVFSAVIVHWGFERVVLIAIPGIAVSALLIMQVRPPASPAAGGGRFDWAPIRTMRRPLTLLFLAVFFRSAVQVTFTQFLALYLNRERGYSLQMSAWILTVYLTAGAVGGLLGGRLADRFGPRLVIALSFLLSAPCMALFFVVPGWAGIASLIVGGLILLFTIPVNVLVAQELVPQSAGTVSALMMGFAWGSAGLIFIPLTGFLSDHTSLHLALSLLLVWPVAGFFLTLKLPKDLIR